MKTTTALSLILALSFAAPASAVEVAGVKVADTSVAEGKTLKLNGAGLRTRLMFKVYVAGLYLETPSKDAAGVVAADQVKRIELSILRSLKGSQVSEAIEEGFEKNSKSQMPALRARLADLEKMIPDVAKGDVIALTYAPGKGTVVAVRGAENGVIPGKDFGDALFSVWLGANPVQEDLKTKLLGGS